MRPRRWSCPAGPIQRPLRASPLRSRRCSIRYRPASTRSASTRSTPQPSRSRVAGGCCTRCTFHRSWTRSWRPRARRPAAAWRPCRRRRRGPGRQPGWRWAGCFPTVSPINRVALVAGRISPEKGIEDAIAAARSIGLPVRLAGAHYDPSYAPNLAGADILGSLPREELRRVMATSAVTICAVRWDEPFGMVAAEAQMAGCPVAAYHRGAMPEVVEDGVSGMLALPGDTASLAIAIEECLALDRSAVRASARRRLGLDAAIERYESALELAAR